MLLMAMPAHLEKWWAEHPERWKGRAHYRRPRPPEFPHDGTLTEQHKWFVDEFLRLARQAQSSREQARFLAYAARVSLQGKPPPAGGIQRSYAAGFAAALMKLSRPRPGPIRAKP